MNLKRINNALLLAVVAVNLYTVAAPLAPQAYYWWGRRHGKVQQLQARATASSSGQKPQAQPQTPNGIVVPSMLLDTAIVEGPKKDMYKMLDKGIWRWPDSSTPDKGGNTVLLGHRFTYANPRGVLYFLDKVQTGDTISLSWNNKKYIYMVYDIRQVPPTDTAVIAPTKEPTLTMYTCTPLWKPHDRLVVTAGLERIL